MLAFFTLCWHLKYILSFKKVLLLLTSAPQITEQLVLQGTSGGHVVHLFPHTKAVFPWRRFQISPCFSQLCSQLSHFPISPAKCDGHIAFGRETEQNGKENRGTRKRNWLSRKPSTSLGNYTPCGLQVLQLDILMCLCSHFVHCSRFTTGHATRANVIQIEQSLFQSFLEIILLQSLIKQTFFFFTKSFFHRCGHHRNCNAIC